MAFFFYIFHWMRQLRSDEWGSARHPWRVFWVLGRAPSIAVPRMTQKEPTAGSRKRLFKRPCWMESVDSLHMCAFNQSSSQLLHHLPAGSPLRDSALSARWRHAKESKSWCRVGFSFRTPATFLLQKGKEEKPWSRPGNDTFLRQAAEEAPNVQVLFTE